MFILPKHSLKFHKIGHDGSGKCDAFQTNDSNDFVIGTLFEMSQYYRKSLDEVEGHGCGYLDKIVTVTDVEGNNPTEAFTYYATNIDERLIPYSWYLNHVVHGATEIGVPGSYLKTLESIQTKDDPNKRRDAAERAVYKQKLANHRLRSTKEDLLKQTFVVKESDSYDSYDS